MQNSCLKHKNSSFNLRYGNLYLYESIEGSIPMDLSTIKINIIDN